MASDVSPVEKASVSLTLLLAAATAISPFALQIIAPAMPTLSRELKTPEELVQLLVSLSMAALAVSAIIYGPLADRYGRRPVMLSGLALAFFGALLAAMSDAFWAVLLGRLLQAAGAGAGMVLSRAIARDLFAYREAAVLISRITAIMVVAPMMAPLVGGLMLEAISWRAIFYLIAGLCALLFTLLYFRLDESLKEPSPSLSIGVALSDYGLIMRRKAFWAPGVAASASISGFFLFVGGAPYVMERAYNYSAAEYGVLFLAISAAFSAANFVSPWATTRFGPQRVIIGGALGSSAAMAVCALFLALVSDSPLILMTGAVVGAFSAGVAVSNMIAGAVEAAPERAGSASGLLSVLQFGAAGAAAQLASILPADKGWPLAIGMALISVLGAGAYFLLSDRATSEEQPLAK